MAPGSIDVRPAEPQDAEAVAAIYNHGIAERQATFETRPRRPNEILGWLEEGRPFIVAADEDGTILGFARVSAYSTRRAYAGVGEHAVYVAPEARGKGVGSSCWTRSPTPPRSPGTTSSRAGCSRRTRRACGCTGRRGSPRWASRSTTGGSTTSGRTRSWSNGCSARPRTEPARLGSATRWLETVRRASPPGLARVAVRGLRAGSCRRSLLQAGLAAIDIVVGRRGRVHDDVRAGAVRARGQRAARATAALAAVALVLAIASGYWNHYEGSTDHLLRIAIVAAGGILATLAAAALQSAAEQRQRMAILAAVGRLSGAQTRRGRDQGPGRGAGARRGRRLLGRPDRARRRAAAPVRARRGRARHAAHRAAAPARRRHPRGGPAAQRRPTTGHLGLTTTAGRYDKDDLQFFTIVAGRVALVLANARLVTDLRSTQARLDGILNSLAEAVTVNDDQGRTVYANPAATRLLGRDSPSDVVAARPGELAARFTITDEHGRAGRARRPPRPPAGARRAGAGAAHPHDRQDDRPRVLAAHEGEPARGSGPQLRGEHHRGRHGGQGGRAPPALPGAGGSGARLEPRLRADAQARRGARGAVAGGLVRGRPPGTATGASSRSRSRTPTPSKVAMAQELRRRYPPDPAARTASPRSSTAAAASCIADIPDELYDATIADPEQREASEGDRHALGDDRPDALRRGHTGRDHVRDRPTAAGGSTKTTSRSRRISRCARRPPSRTPACTRRRSASRTRCRPACCRRRSRMSPATRRRASYQAGELGADVGGDFYDIVATADAARGSSSSATSPARASRPRR